MRRGTRGRGQVNISRLLYYTNAMVAVWGIKCRSRLNEKFPLPVAADPWQMRNVSKQKALHTFRQQAKYKLNFLLKDKGKFCRAARERARERAGERWREGERGGENGRVRASHCRRLLFCRKMKILIPSGLSAQRPMRPVDANVVVVVVVVEVGNEVTVNRTNPGGR